MGRTLTTQDISWFLDLHEKKQLDLDPPYQRRSVWSPKDRRYFIDTILNNYPAPPVFLHKTLDDNGRATYHVVDGKQRLQTIILFSEGKVSIPNDFSNVDLQKKRFNQLDKATKEAFWNYVLIVEMVPDIGEAAIKNTFERINRNSRKLTAQEMRHAKYDGWFIRTVEAEALREEWKSLGIVTTARAKRMADTQFISELFSLIIKSEISGFDQDDIDQMYADYDDLEEMHEFNDEEFQTKLAMAKGKIKEIVDADQELLEWTKNQGHFYTLWSAIILGRNLPSSAVFAERYKAFMEAVKERLADPLVGSDATGATSEASAYAASYRGASTDKAQRQARHDALLKALQS